MVGEGPRPAGGTWGVPDSCILQANSSRWRIIMAGSTAAHSRAMVSFVIMPGPPEATAKAVRRPGSGSPARSRTNKVATKLSTPGSDHIERRRHGIAGQPDQPGRDQRGETTEDRHREAVAGFTTRFFRNCTLTGFCCSARPRGFNGPFKPLARRAASTASTVTHIGTRWRGHTSGDLKRCWSALSQQQSLVLEEGYTCQVSFVWAGSIVGSRS
jgi:hypothetical protein